MEEVKKDTKAKAKEIKSPPKPKAEPTYLIDWKKAADEVEAAIKERGWTSAQQRRNPQYLDGLLRRHVLRPLVQAVNRKEV